VEWIDLGPSHGLWLERGERTAVVLPGAVGGAFQAPVAFAWQALAAAGWSVVAVHAEYDDSGEEWTPRLAEAAFAFRAPDLVAGKSRGTMAASLVPDVPAIWVTPLLDHPGVVAALERRTAPQLLVGGTNDPTWRADVARRIPGELCELVGADHGLTIEGDALASVDMLRRLVEAITAFSAAL
jgi:pimeloyl-ACP methyl ester carboxylesterase